MNDIIKKDFIDIPSFLTDEVLMTNYGIDPCCETCMSNCEKECKDLCEIGCLSCMGGCEDGGCQKVCEKSCMGGCQGGCQDLCEKVICQTGQGGTTKLPTPSLDTSKTIKTSNSISITILPVANATIYTVKISKNNVIISEQAGASLTMNFTNLTPSTQYTIDIRCSASGYEASDWNSYTATTLTSLWEWHIPKIEGKDFNVTRDEWLAFCTKINEVRRLKGLSDYSFTTSTANIYKDKPFYVWIFLQAVSALSPFSGIAPQLPTLKSGDEIYAWYFTNLKSVLNDAINSI